MGFALMSTILEPVNLQHRIIGFDTFSGFPDLSDKDVTASAKHTEWKVGGLATACFDDLRRCIELFDANRFMGHVPKVLLVKGDAVQTIPAFLKENSHTVVSLLHLDFDLYEPSEMALEHFLPRMPKGAVIIFDELNNQAWPGDTVAVIEKVGLRNLEIKRFTFEPHVSYARL